MTTTPTHSILTPTARIEQRLRDSLARDRKHPSRCTPQPDGTVVVQVSGTSCGLALAIEMQTGEQFDALMERMAR